MRKLVVLGLVTVMVLALLVRRRPRPAMHGDREAARAVAVAPVVEDHASPVRKLSVEDRRALRTQIETALQLRRASPGSKRAGSGPGDDPVIPLERVGTQAQDALRAAIPILAGCYEGSAAPRTALAQMVMISDPELGTVIDTLGITDADGAPIAAALDDCLRTAIESLALPPLGVPGKLPLQYSFRFD